MRMRYFWPGLCSVLAVTLMAGCDSSGGSGEGDPKTLVVATHDSWAMSKEVLADFKKKTGITVKAQPQGDAGQLTNKLVLTKDSPLADGVYGIDNTFASRAVDEGVLSSYTPAALPESAKAFQLTGDGVDRLVRNCYVHLDPGIFKHGGGHVTHAFHQCREVDALARRGGCA